MIMTSLQRSAETALFIFLLASECSLLCSQSRDTSSSSSTFVSAANTNTVTTVNDYDDNPQLDQRRPRQRGRCDIYLAPSTIPGAGMGMFVGDRDFAKGDFLADGDLVIPAYDMNHHVGHKKYHLLWEEYTWKAASFFGMKEEVESVKNVRACSPGFGAAVNCILPMVNIKDDVDSRTVSMSSVNASTSPGAGAFTIYHGRRWKAKVDIPAGMELYGNYGAAYFRTRPEYGPIPFTEDYKAVDKILKTYRAIISKKQPHSNHEDTNFDWGLGLLDLLQTMPTIWDDSRTMNAIPRTQNVGAIDWLLERGRGAGYQHYNTSTRSVEWLRENGRCMTNIYDAVSSIPHAGRGAFASIFLPQGKIVAPAPLIQIPDRGIFTVYADQLSNVTKSNGKIEMKFVSDHTRPIHQQLLLNYCFGHRDSSLLLCPYGLLTSHINHDDKNPNTRIQWAKDENMAHPEWRNQSIDVWGSEGKAGLSFDFVALRDIQPHEEITVDYGREWSLAWQRHVKGFQQPRRNYIPAFEWNDRINDTLLPTIDELLFESTGVRVFCHEDHLRWANVLPIVERKTTGDSPLEDWHGTNIYPCRITHRTTKARDDGAQETYAYVAEVYHRTKRKSSDWDGRSKWHPMSVEFTVAVALDLPRDAFYFADEVYQRPHHRPWSFRHDMRIPDDIFPDAWRNRKVD